MEIFLSLLGIILAVLILAVVTDKFFIPSLDVISRRLQLSDEVAGASLMAIGSSAPELAIALVALFTNGGAHSDVGIGAIVGSAVFNILVITGVSAVVAGGLHVHVFAVRRDIIYYLISIAYLGLVFFDGHISLIEAILGLVGYAVYMGVLILVKGKEVDEEAAEPAKHAIDEAERAPIPLWTKFESLISSWLRRITGDPEQNFIWAFALSITLIVGLSYALVQFTIVFSQGIGIPPVIVALTLLAAGTSAPDLMSSVDVAREGRGGMAVANAVGSNTFDLLIGLALPWSLALAFQGIANIEVGTGNLWISIGILVLTTVVLFAFLEIERGLSRLEGFILLLLYAAFVIYTVASGNVI